MSRVILGHSSRLDSGQGVGLRIDVSHRVVDHRTAKRALHELLSARVLQGPKWFVLTGTDDVVDQTIAIFVIEIVNFMIVRTRISDVPLPVQIPLVFARHDLAPEKVYPLINATKTDQF